MPTVSHADALGALLALARHLTGANMAAALVQRAPGVVVPLRAEPPIGLTHAPVWHWQLPTTRRGDEAGLLTVPPEQLPSLVATGLPFTPALVAYLDCTAWGEHVAGGLLFLWDEAQAPSATELAQTNAQVASPVWLLRPVYARLLDGRHLAVQTVESGAQFHDIFNSVPQGIVVVSGQGAQAQVNQVASELLQIPGGPVSVDVLAPAMRTVRARCDNTRELELAYQALQQNLDAEVVVNWTLDDHVWRVSTRPILQDGHNGRVWLFQDITAQIRLEHVLRMEASHDALTGLFNRRAFFDRAQARYHAQALSPAPSEGGEAPTGLALLLLDIDHFKAVNDRFGHPVGDQVLRDVAHRARALLREGDVLARYGGEEFILLMGPTARAAARAAAERLRLAMAAAPVQVNGLSIDVRISVGLTLRRDAHETLAQTIERADRNLYRAKRDGRNRVVDDTQDRLPAA